jgi:hypothetical protein
MAAHKGPASSRPRCTQSGSSVAAIPVYQSNLKKYEMYVHLFLINFEYFLGSTEYSQ